MNTQSERCPLTSSPRWAPVLLAGLAAIILLPGTGTMPLVDRDEPRFAQATLEMMRRGEWVVPYFNEEYRFDKPVLIYWMMRVFYGAMGVHELSARMPSVVSAVALAWVVLWMGRRWFSPETGFLAGFGLLTCVQMFLHGRSAVADLPMVVSVVLAQLAVFELLHAAPDPYPWRWFHVLCLSLGFGFLAKGPVTWVAPLLTLLIQRWVLWRKPLPWRMLKLHLAVPMALLITAAWGIPALVKTHGEFLTVGIHTHLWKRGFDTFQGHGSFFLYYLVMALVSLYPWIALAGDGVAVLRRSWNEKNAFLLSWLLGTYVLFSFYMTKLPHYVLPAFPAFFLVIAQTRAPGFRPPAAARAWFWFAILLLPAVAAVAAAAALTLRFSADYAGLRAALLGGAGVVGGLAFVGILWRFRRFRLLLLPLLVVAAATRELAAGLRAVTPAIALRGLCERLPGETEHGFFRFTEPSLVFYTDRRWERLTTVEEANAFLARPGPRVLVTAVEEIRIEDYLEALGSRWRGQEARPVVRDYSEDIARLDTTGYEPLDCPGINIARACSVRVRAYRRSP